jgi:hypothetical protein
MKMTKKFTKIWKIYYQWFCLCQKINIILEIIYGIYYRVANFYRTWLWNVRGCDPPEEGQSQIQESMFNDIYILESINGKWWVWLSTR